MYILLETGRRPRLHDGVWIAEPMAGTLLAYMELEDLQLLNFRPASLLS